MEGKIIREAYKTRKIMHFGNIGEYAFTYDGVDYHVGDVVFIMDTSFVRRTTLVVKVREGYYIHGYPGTLNGVIHKCYILQLRIVKKYTELTHNRYIDGFTVKLDGYKDDNEDDYSLNVYNYNATDKQEKLSNKQLNKMLKLEDKLSIIELSINLLLSKYKTLNQLEKTKLDELGKKYSVLYELLKEKEDMELVSRFKKKSAK